MLAKIRADVMLQTEKGVDAQKRLIKDFYETVGDYTPQ